MKKNVLLLLLLAFQSVFIVSSNQDSSRGEISEQEKKQRISYCIQQGLVKAGDKVTFDKYGNIKTQRVTVEWDLSILTKSPIVTHSVKKSDMPPVPNTKQIVVAKLSQNVSIEDLSAPRTAFALLRNDNRKRFQRFAAESSRSSSGVAAKQLSVVPDTTCVCS